MKKTVYVTSCAVKYVGDECDLSFAPPMMKRRFSPLQKVAFSLLNAVAPKGSAPKTVFASRDGEVKLTHELVGAFNAGDGVSPWKFSSSVYNAAPGLYSVYSGNRSTYTAIAAGDETIENSLIEAVFEAGGSAWCYAEEGGGGYGLAARFEDFPADGRAEMKVEIGSGNPENPEMSFSGLAGFLRGECGELVGKRLALKRVG